MFICRDFLYNICCSIKIYFSNLKLISVLAHIESRKKCPNFKSSKKEHLDTDQFLFVNKRMSQ